MEHSAQYDRIMNARAERAQKKADGFGNFTRIFGYSFLGLCALLALMYGIIRIDHSKAVRDYNKNNWVIVNDENGVRNVHGMVDGEQFSYVDDGRYYKGACVEGVDLGGMDYESARAAVMSVVEDKLNSINMVITVGDASLTMSASDFNVSVNAAEALEKAYMLGRESINDPTANYLKQKKIAAEPVNFTLEYACDRGRIAERVASIAAFVDTEPVEPYVTVSSKPSAYTDTVDADDDSPVIKDTDTVVDTVYAANGVAIGYIYYNPGKEGFVLDQDTMIDRIEKAFKDGDYDCNLSAELERTAPELTPADIVGSVVQITSYTSEFDHDDKHMNRCRNVQKAAGILNACVIKPGQEISFNKYVGPRTEAGGWLRAAGIVGGREYEDSPGGGICQVSGTLYNALLQCGPNKIKITQRQHHSWPSSYVPIGLDATVDTNGPDLKWRNISDSAIYIFTYADVKKGIMYVYMYGFPEEDGSYYETFAEVTEEKDPPEAKIVKEPLWPSGYERTVITERIGYTAKAYLMHYDKDGQLIEQMYRYTDSYFPVQGEIHVGTGSPFLPKPGKNG